MSTNIRAIFMALGMLLTMFTLSAQEKNKKIDSKFDNVNKELTALYNQRNFSGTILVAKNGKITYQRNIGYADIEHNIPISSNTKFELASVSKTFTAILILKLVEKGKMELNGKISDYLPEFTRSDANQITIHHLLSHTSGIQDFVGLNCDFGSWTEKEFFEGLQKTPVNFNAGKEFQYSSSTYILLRFIIEQVTGNTYEDNLKEYILRPAGMMNSGVIHNQEIIKNRALGYVNTGEKVINAMPVANHEIFIGAASIYSTSLDLLKFDQALNSNQLLREKEKALMYTIVQSPYAYGWFVQKDPKRGLIVSHGGDIFGFTTLIERRLSRNEVIIILGNLQGIDRQKIINVLNKTL